MMYCETITQKVDFIFSKLKYLKKNKPDGIKQFKSDEMLQLTIFNTMYICIEEIVDIMAFIDINEYGIEYNGEYEMFESSFEPLFEMRIIEEKVFDKLRYINALRNSLVHNYDFLSIERIYENYDGILRDMGYVTNALIKLIKDFD